MEVWPNFFIVGAPRAGTTSMYEFLKSTPRVFMSKIKEPHYFSSFKSQYMYGKLIQDKKKYLELFKDVKDEVAIGEASTSYLWDAYSCKAIHREIPQARIVMMLRDPVKRSFSHYLMRVGGGQTLSFSEVIKLAIESSPEDYYNSIIVKGGFYSEQVKRYLEVFGHNQVKIIIFEEFIKDTKKIVKELLEFLQVSSEFPEKIKSIHNEYTIPRGKIVTSLLRNKFVRKVGEQIPTAYYEPIVKKILSKKSSKPVISEKDKNFLQDLYANDVKKLKAVLGRELPWSIT